MLLAAWTAQHLISAILRGPLIDYVASWGIVGLGFLGFVLPYAVTAGGIAWGDYCRDSHVRRVAPIVTFGLLAGLVSYMLRGMAYPWALESWFCGAFTPCDLIDAPAWASIQQSRALPVAGAILAPINALMGMGIAALTIPKRPLMKLRTHRWAIAVAVWLSGSLLGALIASLDVETVGDAWIVVGTPLIVPALFTLGVLAATRGQAHA